MKIERKKDVGKITFKHNRVLFWIILVLIVLFIVLIIYMMNNWEQWEAEKNGINECNTNSDCVKETCCHASTCTSIENAPECGDLFCTTECVPGTLDCGGGKCKCVKGKCEAVFE